MRKIGLLMMALICALCVCAAAEEGQNQDNNQTITMEYMIRHCELTEADFEGIDFDEFAAYFELTPEVLEEFDGASLLSLYKMQLEMIEGSDYTEIYREASGKLQEEDIEHISTVILEVHQSMYNGWMAADFDQMAVYGGMGFGLECCTEKEKLSELMEEDVAFILEQVAKAGMTGWDNIYTGNDDEGVCDNNFDWAIGIRLDSGKCIRYEGSGMEGVPVMEQLTTFCRTLWDRYAENVKK